MVPSARKAALRMGLTECIARAASPQGCLPRLRRGDPRGMAGETPANPATPVQGLPFERAEYRRRQFASAFFHHSVRDNRPVTQFLDG